ncbi:MAG: (2Fe-2S) ferredoxin domain-containing protein [Desulfobacterales bacterium]|nr:(2Fe-2S) ferredoxin domain-containing protein [Desulfobacterales bacterium]
MGKMTIEDLQRIKEKTLHETALRHQQPNVRVTVHMGDCGIAAGARPVMNAVIKELGKSGRHDIHVLAADCLGVCETEPNVTVEVAGQNPVVYQKMDADKVRQVFERHVLNNEVLTDHTVEVPEPDHSTETSKEA